ncbi:MAG: glucokinase [Planctomycetaceae bacterium]
MILAGDIGGTKTRLAFFDVSTDRLRMVEEARYSSREYASLDEIALRFLKEHRLEARYACFGVAGPVRHGVCRATNLAWTIDAAQLAKKMGIETVLVINDLEATAYAIGELEDTEYAVLQPGAPDAEGNRGVIAAGTGLGEAGMYWDGERHRPFACEGGHSDFSPRNAPEAELLFDLRAQFGHAAWERVLSGPGLFHIYTCLRDHGIAQESADVARAISKGDPAPTISQAALANRCPLCVATLDMFVSLYGAEAGNLALKLMATGGIYIGGGIAARILPKMRDGTFVKAFSDKGRLSDILEQIPIKVILNEKAALIGAAQCARLHGAQ